MIWTPGFRSSSGNIVEKLADVLVHQQIRGITRVMGDRLGSNEITALDPERRRQAAIEVAPVYGVLVGRENVKLSVGSRFRATERGAFLETLLVVDRDG